MYVLWGATFFAMRIGVESFPPLILAGMRHFSVGLVLYPLLRWRTRIRPTAEQWRTAAITGVLLLSVGNGGVCWAEQTVPSGIAALLVATVTLWMVIVDWLRPGGHRPSARILFGIVSADSGVAGVGLRVALFQARDTSQFAYAGRGDAGTVRRGDAVDYVALQRRGGAISSSGSAAARLGGGRLPDGLWVVHRIHGIPLYIEEKHGGTSGNVRFRQSDCGAGHRLGVGRGSLVATDSAGRRGHFNGGSAGDYRATSQSQRSSGCVAGSRRSVGLLVRIVRRKLLFI